MLDIKEIKDQKEDQLKNLIEDLEKEIFELKNKLALDRKLEKPHLIREKRRTKARILTILRERKEEKDEQE